MNEKKDNLEFKIEEALTILHLMVCLKYGDYPQNEQNMDNAVNDIYEALKINDINLKKIEIKNFLEEARSFEPKDIDKCKAMAMRIVSESKK